MLRCSICGITTEHAEEALDKGWIPYFLEGSDEHGPCCPECFDAVLHVDKEGEPRIREEFRGKIVYIEEFDTYESTENPQYIVYN